LIVQPATLRDVVRIGEGMWERGKEELGQLGVTEVMWLQGWKEKIQRGEAVAVGEHALLGWDFERDGEICTSFQAAKTFELPGVGKQVTKALRKEIPRLMEERGVRVASVYSLCVDPDSPKWFRVLGFTEDTDYRGIKRGPYISRRFVRRA
jgi:hypothetical protein